MGHADHLQRSGDHLAGTGAFGYTVEPMVCLYPMAKPIVGLARVGMIRSTEPPRGKVTDRADWYDYVIVRELRRHGYRDPRSCFATESYAVSHHGACRRDAIFT